MLLGLLRNTFALFPARDKWKLFNLLLLMIISTGLELLGIGAIPVFLLAVSSPEKLEELPLLSNVVTKWELGPEEILFGGAAIMLSLFILKNAFLVCIHYVTATFAYRRFTDIGNQLFTAYMHAPYEYHLGQNSSGLVRNITQDSLIFARDILDAGLKLIKNLLGIAGIAILLFWIEPAITLATVIFLGAVTWVFLRSLKKKMSRHGQESRNARKDMIRTVQEGLGGLKDIRILGKEVWFLSRLRKAMRNFAQASIFKNVAQASNKPVIETFAIAGILLIALALHIQGRPAASMVPLLALFGAAAIRLMPMLTEAVSMFNSLQFHQHITAGLLRDLSTISKTPAHKPSSPNPVSAASDSIPLQRTIEVDHVTYAYPGSLVPTLQALNLTIRKGQVVSFVGSSGAGKTTLVDILLGMLAPQKGDIRVDGRSIYDDLPAWRESIGYVPQSIFFLDATLRENIALGIPAADIDEGRLQAAVQAAYLGELVDQLPHGLDTPIGERGTRLSGGQRQRIGIARALYRNPTILILDEATSALDNVSERYVTQAIENIRSDMTIIMVAHRLTTVKMSDVIFLMEKGAVSAQGRYEELLQHSALFMEMASEHNVQRRDTFS